MERRGGRTGDPSRKSPSGIRHLGILAEFEKSIEGVWAPSEIGVKVAQVGLPRRRGIQRTRNSTRWATPRLLTASRA